jgi:hypothetical protein
MAELDDIQEMCAKAIRAAEAQKRLWRFLKWHRMAVRCFWAIALLAAGFFMKHPTQTATPLWMGFLEQSPGALPAQNVRAALC